MDVEGYEDILMRELLVSGALCGTVDELWVEWHPHPRARQHSSVQVFPYLGRGNTQHRGSRSDGSL